MKILVLNGSPRQNGSTAAMVAAFAEGAKEAGHDVTIIPVAKKKIAGCIACEHCHSKGNGTCIQKDDMQEIYPLLKETEMLVLASPIYYHGISGQLKCVIDRFYAVAYPNKPPKLKPRAIKVVRITSAIFGCRLKSSRLGKRKLYERQKRHICKIK